MSLTNKSPSLKIAQANVTMKIFSQKKRFNFYFLIRKKDMMVWTWPFKRSLLVQVCDQVLEYLHFKERKLLIRCFLNE